MRPGVSRAHLLRRSAAAHLSVLCAAGHEQREGRAPTARETISVDEDTVNLGAWLAKARSKHGAGQLPAAPADLVAVPFDGDWTAEDAWPAVLASSPAPGGRSVQTAASRASKGSAAL
ncbi:hypothetical protein [Streptomyces sp. DT195]|uniref:hypothetical protein n=1 Tax=Streptomyces sp. DT195 TaxID=3393419 RepID=UPI003CF8273A